MTGSDAPEPLLCPSCGRTYDDDSRFCARCNIPLMPVGEPLIEPISDAHDRARKIKPQYAEGELVRVAGGRNQTEAEFIQGLLLEEGVPSLLRRTRGFDVPDFMAAGPRDILVPASGASAARDVLLQADLAEKTDGPGPVAPWKVLAGILVGVGLILIFALLFS